MRWLRLVFVVLAACEGGKGGALPPTDGGSGLPCGGIAGTQCPADEFCDFGRNSCGFADEGGTCRPRPNACGEIAQPSCGCDGVVYGNPCEANQAGVDVSDVGGCQAPVGQFACGHLFCPLDTTYCRHLGNDIGEEPDGFQCASLPASCGASPSCACLIDEPCGDICDGDAATGMEVTCLGG